MQRVGLFPTGYLPADVDKLRRFLNGAQSYYSFERATSIENMGPPDLRGYAYSDCSLAALVRPYEDRFDYLVLLTSVPIEDNFYTKSLSPKIIVLTAFESEGILVKSGRSIEEGIAIGLCGELVSVEFQRVTGRGWEELFHPDTRGCLFDYAGLKSQAVAKLKRCEICDASRGLLKETNINDQLLETVEGILRRIRRPSFTTALVRTLATPVLGFVYGGVVLGGAVSLVVAVLMSQVSLNATQKSALWTLGAGVVLLPLGVWCWDWIRYLRSRLS